MLPRRRLISLSPRYFSTWQCRRLSTGSAPHLWTPPCRRSHTLLCLRTFLRRWVLAQLPRFLLMCLFRLLYAVLCYTMFPHNYRSRSSLLDVSSRTILWTAKTLFVSLRHQYKVHVPCCSRRQDSNSQPRLLNLPLTLTCSLHMVRLLSAFPVMPCSRLSVPQTQCCGPPHAQLWALQNLRPQSNRHSGQRYHASSIPPFPSSVESRPGA